MCSRARQASTVNEHGELATASLHAKGQLDTDKRTVIASDRLSSVDQQRRCTSPVSIVGAGPSGIRLAQEILAIDPLAKIDLYGNEPYAPYNRAQLSAVLAREVQRDAIDLEMPAPGRYPNFTYRLANIVELDTAKHVITDVLGTSYPYEKLVLAVGSRARVPTLSGCDLKGVYTFRNLKDTDSLYARLASSRHIVVIGGGLLGLEAAKALRRANTRVTVLQQSGRLMNRQLDDRAAALLAEKVSDLGIEVMTGSRVAEILGERKVSGVRTGSGDLIECDTVLLCTGIKPNTELALRARLAIGKGIKIDDTLATSQPDVFAIGECAEYREATYGLVSPGYEQAAVLADRLCAGESLYRQY